MVLVVGILHAVEVERCVVADIGLDDLCGEEVVVVGGMVAEQEFSLGTLLHHDEHASVDHHAHVGAQDVDNLHTLFHLHVFRHIDEEAVLGQHRVERRDGVLLRLGDARIVASDEFGMLLGRLSQRSDDDSLLGLYVGQPLLIERIVDDEIEQRTQVGHVAAEGRIGIDRKLDAIDVQTVVGSEDLLYVGVLISLHLPCREALAAEVFEGAVADGVHHLRAMLLDGFRGLRV